jgi:hypothetical protein
MVFWCLHSSRKNYRILFGIDMNQCKYLATLKLLVEVVANSKNLNSPLLATLRLGSNASRKAYPRRCLPATSDNSTEAGPPGIESIPSESAKAVYRRRRALALSPEVQERVLRQGHKSSCQISTFWLTSLVWLSGRVGPLRERWPLNFIATAWSGKNWTLRRLFIVAYDSNQGAQQSDILPGK